MTAKLSGGNSSQVIRQGNPVVRHTDSWSTFVHHLLQFLTASGFTESPVLLESFSDIEQFTFIEGTGGNDPLEPFMQSDDVLVEAASLLRRFHDLTQNFVVPADAVFQLPVNDSRLHEVICHNDFAPYNCVFRDNHLLD